MFQCGTRCCVRQHWHLYVVPTVAPSVGGRNHHVPGIWSATKVAAVRNSECPDGFGKKRGGEPLPTLTCCTGRCQASRWSPRGCGWKLHSRSRLGSSGVCNRSTPAREQRLLSFSVNKMQEQYFIFIFFLVELSGTHLLDPDICGHHLVLLILIGFKQSRTWGSEFLFTARPATNSLNRQLNILRFQVWSLIDPSFTLWCFACDRTDQHAQKILPITDRKSVV